MSLAMLLLLSLPVAAAEIVGDGAHDDTAGIQALLDERRSLVELPAPPAHYLISRTLRIHSGQTLHLARFTTVRLKPGSDCPMITNDDHDKGNENVSLVGGIWDMCNESQSLAEYQKTRDWHGVYEPGRYLGVLMRFNRVKRLTLRGLTLKDPVTFSTQLGNLDEFTIDDITFDHNLRRTNMDGIHIHGNSRGGRITNLKGATNDDLVALNADDGGIFEMSRGPIEDIVVDGIWARDGYTAVRLLSAGSPIRRVRLANIFGTYRFNVVSFTNHRVHPGAASTFDEVVIDGVWCAKSGKGMSYQPAQPGASHYALIWIDAPARVTGLTIANLHRAEDTWPAASLHVEAGVSIDSLALTQVHQLNRTPGPLDLLVNRGDIGHLSLSQVHVAAGPGPARGAMVRNSGRIGERASQLITTGNTTGEWLDETTPTPNP